MYDLTNDCHYANPHPDWGTQGLAGDPYLDQDDTDGYGPETIYISEPFESGMYQYKVHYRSDNGHGPTTATVTVWYYGEIIEQWQKSLVNGEVWNCLNYNLSTNSFGTGTPFFLMHKEADTAEAHPGDTITYSFWVGNFSNVSLSSITITDIKLQNSIAFKQGDCNGNGLLDNGEIWIFTAEYVVTGSETSPLVNSATVTGIDTSTGTLVTTWATASVIITPG
jgi:uncharacterized repeat protein (TIGR01451 family)